MPLLDRHRLVTLMGLTTLERTVTGPGRLLREPDVALLIKAAYDDASDPARATFMARVQAMPTSAWPWSAVQAPARPPLDVRPRGGGGGVGNLGVPQPPATPALLLLLRGQVDSADADPGNKLPDRNTPEGAAWEPLQVALDRWDTVTIRRYIRPQGWALPSTTPKEGQDAGASSGAPAQGGAPAPTPGVPATQTTVPLWKQPAVLAAGATALVATSVTVYALTRDSKSQRLEAELERQAREAMKR